MIFKKNRIAAIAEGDFCAIDFVPDEVFSQKMMGDGYAVKNHNGKIYSPFKGTVESIFPTKHAIVLRNEKDIPMLIHMGLETVNLKDGTAFSLHVAEGDKVIQGDIIAEMDLNIIKQNGFDSIVIAVLPDKNDVKVSLEHGEILNKKDIVMRFV